MGNHDFGTAPSNLAIPGASGVRMLRNRHEILEVNGNP
jgi:hypothetical protein